MASLFLFGASGHARVVIDVLEMSGLHRIHGIVDRALPKGSEFCGYPILGGEADLPDLVESTGIRQGVVAIGDNWVRFQVMERVALAISGFSWVHAVHPAVVMAHDAVVGAGSVVMAGAVLNPGVRVGEGCIVNTGALVDHECALGDYCSVAPGAVLGGNVRVGNFAAVGLGAQVIHGMRIGEHSVVGAGALVVDHVDDCVVSYGCPAQMVRRRDPGDRYL